MSDGCGNCKFWVKRSDAQGEKGGGFCRRFPPAFPSLWNISKNIVPVDRVTFDMTPGAIYNDAWPNTHSQSWCGEYVTATFTDIWKRRKALHATVNYPTTPAEKEAK